MKNKRLQKLMEMAPKAAADELVAGTGMDPESPFAALAAKVELFTLLKRAGLTARAREGRAVVKELERRARG